MALPFRCESDFDCIVLPIQVKRELSPLLPNDL